MVDMVITTAYPVISSYLTLIQVGSYLGTSASVKLVLDSKRHFPDDTDLKICGIRMSTSS
jgi:hypothetical protein